MKNNNHTNNQHTDFTILLQTVKTVDNNKTMQTIRKLHIKH